MTTVDRPQVTPSAASLPQSQAAPKAKTRIWRWIVLLLVLYAVCGGGYWLNERFHLITWKSGKDSEKAKKRAIPVVTTTARRGDLSLYLSSLGTVTARQTVTVRSRVDGELTKVLFTEGQMVKEGDLLAEIDVRPYEVQLKQAEGQLARDKATLKQAQLDLARDKKLMVAPSGAAITQQALDAQVAVLGQYEGAVKTDEAMADNARLQLKYCHITAPITGRIGLRLVDKGNLVQAASTTGLAVIAEIQPITVIFTVPQDEVFRVQQKFNTGEELVVEAWNRDLSTKLANGRLWAIDNQVDTTTGTVKLRAIFANEDQLLFPNEFVNAKLLVDTRRNAVIVPATAVQRGPNSTFAYVVKKDKEKDTMKVEMRDLKLGPTEGEQTVVESGLSAGDVVVTEGVDKLFNDAEVELRGPKPEGDAKAKVAAGSRKREAKAAR